VKLINQAFTQILLNDIGTAANVGILPIGNMSQISGTSLEEN